MGVRQSYKHFAAMRLFSRQTPPAEKGFLSVASRNPISPLGDPLTNAAHDSSAAENAHSVSAARILAGRNGEDPFFNHLPSDRCDLACKIDLRLRALRPRDSECLIQIFHQIVSVFDPDRNPDQVGGRR